MSKYLIFDFDGTIVDSFATVLAKFNGLAEQYRFRRIELEEVTILRDLSSRELLKYLNIPFYKIPIIFYHARINLHEEMVNLIPFANLREVLQTLHQANFSLGILTSNSWDNVSTWLDTHDMKHFFQFIHTGSSYLGKKNLIKKTLKKYNINKSQAFYIGDETRDIEAAKQNDIYSIAVTWGFNSEKILTQYQPHYIARQPSDILKICGL